MTENLVEAGILRALLAVVESFAAEATAQLDMRLGG